MDNVLREIFIPQPVLQLAVGSCDKWLNYTYILKLDSTRFLPDIVQKRRVFKDDKEVVQTEQLEG